jgi:hypothetical protein
LKKERQPGRLSLLKPANGKQTMKLKFLFFLMDLATLLAYPVVFVLGKLSQVSKSFEVKTLARQSVVNAQAGK